jgi:hypothetical protein
MAEIVNLRRARKAKKRAEEKAASAKSAPGVKKRTRNLAKAENAKIAHDLDARKLDKP